MMVYHIKNYSSFVMFYNKTVVIPRKLFFIIIKITCIHSYIISKWEYPFFYLCNICSDKRWFLLYGLNIMHSFKVCNTLGIFLLGNKFFKIFCLVKPLREKLSSKSMGRGNFETMQSIFWQDTYYLTISVIVADVILQRQSLWFN